MLYNDYNTYKFYANTIAKEVIMDKSYRALMKKLQNKDMNYRTGVQKLVPMSNC